MDRLWREYRLEEGDPCSKITEKDTVKRLESMRSIVQLYDEQRDSIHQGVGEVKRNADYFLKLLSPAKGSGNCEVLDLSFDRVEFQVKELCEQLKTQEQQVMEIWLNRKGLADHCLQYLELETCAKEVQNFHPE